MQKPKKIKRKTKKTVRKLKKGKGVDPQAAAIMKKVAGKTQDPVRSGSAGSGKVTKTKSFTEKVKSYMGYKYGGKMKMKYNDGGRVQHD